VTYSEVTFQYLANIPSFWILKQERWRSAPVWGTFQIHSFQFCICHWSQHSLLEKTSYCKYNLIISNFIMHAVVA
jgi:hypothetical protein